MILRGQICPADPSLTPVSQKIGQVTCTQCLWQPCYYKRVFISFIVVTKQCAKASGQSQQIVYLCGKGKCVLAHNVANVGKQGNYRTGLWTVLPFHAFVLYSLLFLTCLQSTKYHFLLLIFMKNLKSSRTQNIQCLMSG